MTANKAEFLLPSVAELTLRMALEGQRFRIAVREITGCDSDTAERLDRRLSALACTGLRSVEDIRKEWMLRSAEGWGSPLVRQRVTTLKVHRLLGNI